jgi:hypothetical protein
MDEIRRRYAIFSGALLIILVGSLVASTYAVTQNIISISAYRFAVPPLILGYIGGITVVVRKIRQLPPISETTSEGLKKPTKWLRLRIWSLQGLIAVLVFSLVYGNWIERNGPWLPRLVGSIVNLGWTWLSFKRLRLLKQTMTETTYPSG